ncbi:MAG: type II secretion system protein GspD [Deltaproteobacteria bacterium RIFCSPLOWO2_01_44_7]|nr:MAG: type II secretion system protein GspD [Deltaproteobacteria bacterium RIFCSPLOWO2_01_44_7]
MKYVRLKKERGLSLRVFVGAPNKTPQQTLRTTRSFFNKSFGFVFFVLITFSAYAQLPEGAAQLPGAEDVFTPQVEQPTPPSETKAETVPTEAQKTEAQKEEEQPVSPEEELVYLNVQDQDIKEIIKQISKATGRNFIIDAKVSGKITILSNKMMSKEEAYQAFLSALQVAGFTTVAGPGGVLKIIPTRDAKNFPIPTHVDSTPYTDSYITRLIKMENISANDMAEAIKGLISRDGNLFAYPETNTLVLTDSGTNIDRLMKIIKELDQEGPQQTVEIIPIHFASAKELASIVLKIFEEQKGKGGGARPTGGLEEGAQVSQIIADDRTNSLIVLATKRAMEKVKELINRLDAKLEEGAEGKIHVHYLKYAKAKDITSVLQGLAGQAAKPPGQGGADKGPIIAELEDFKVSADETTNSLLITASAKTYNNLVEKVIDKLDIPRKQVYLEAMVIEFTLARKKEFGISAHGGVAGGSTVGFGETFKQLTNLFDPLAAGTFAAPGLLGGILSTRTVDIKVLDKDGAQKTISLPAFSAFLTALNSFGDTNIVASPNLLALDNEESSIEIIRKEPEAGQTTITGTGLSQAGPPSRVEAGLKLKLTPQITERGAVRMKIDQSYSSFVTPANTTLGSQAIVERKVATSVITNDAQTVVIGGLMEDKIITAKTKVPILGDIPLLGYLFQKKETTKGKSNLLLFITPHIIRDSGDFQNVLSRKLAQQDDFLDKNFKRKEKKTIETTIEGHNPDLLDILAKAPASSASSTALPPMSAQERMAYTPAVITAKPDDEPRITIVLPARSEESFDPPALPKEEKRSKKKIKEETVIEEAPKTTTKKSVEVKPIEKEMIETKETEKPATKSVPKSAPESAPPTIEVIPPKPAKKEAKATAPIEPAPMKVESKPKTQKTETKKSTTGGSSTKMKHAPVITLPPGTTPDMGE